MEELQDIEKTAVDVAAEQEVKRLRKRSLVADRKYGDPYLWGIYIMLCILSFVITYDAAGREIHNGNVYGPLIKQGIFLFAGGGIAYLLHRIDYSRYVNFIPYFCCFALGALLYVEMFGEEINGAQRHISLMGFSIQPTEIAKLGVVLGMAYIMARNQVERDVKWRGILFCLALVAVFGVFLVKQGLTNTLLLMVTTLAMLVVSGAKWRKILTLLGVFGGFVATLFLVIVICDFGDKPDADNLEGRETAAQSGVVIPVGEEEKVESSTLALKLIDYVEMKVKPVIPRVATHANRLRRFLDPTPLYERKFCEENNQEMFAHIAQAHGGIPGVGIGNSKYSNMLPLAFSDYVFSIVMEDLGLWGGIVLLILYLFILMRAGYIAQQCSRALPALMVIGLAFLIVSQALFHMAINTGVFPVSGQPLPLISMGGTSILVISIAFGIMQSVCRSACTAKDKKSEIKAEIEALPEGLRGANESN